MLNRKTLVKIISWIPVILWMFLIYTSSAQVADDSNELSKGITQSIVETVESIIPGNDISVDNLNYLIRKSAHFFTYLILALLVLNAVRKSRIYGIKSFTISLGICVLYAISDETHQLFVPGRGGQATDVLIDTSGAMLGIGIYGFTSRMKYSNKANQK
ncbi:VanZ family protein [Paenisporosarcina sp. TG20]|uniref:VanZ family protein n=1 Tax=Paenisporosarcina sp. TG20 TaxID=1211706 RepID=UPI000300FAAB|nr:VanZ family protein [Paenisporosarcina sp. TG20]